MSILSHYLDGWFTDGSELSGLRAFVPLAHENSWYSFLLEPRINIHLFISFSSVPPDCTSVASLRLSVSFHSDSETDIISAV
jgi:hypothetical protein